MVLVVLDLTLEALEARVHQRLVYGGEHLHIASGQDARLVDAQHLVEEARGERDTSLVMLGLERVDVVVERAELALERADLLVEASARLLHARARHILGRLFVVEQLALPLAQRGGVASARLPQRRTQARVVLDVQRVDVGEERVLFGVRVEQTLHVELELLLLDELELLFEVHLRGSEAGAQWRRQRQFRRPLYLQRKNNRIVNKNSTNIKTFQSKILNCSFPVDVKCYRTFFLYLYLYFLGIASASEKQNEIMNFTCYVIRLQLFLSHFSKIVSVT